MELESILAKIEGGVHHGADIERQTSSHEQSHLEKFRVAIEPNLYVFGLWEEAEVDKEESTQA